MAKNIKDIMNTKIGDIPMLCQRSFLIFNLSKVNKLEWGNYIAHMYQDVQEAIAVELLRRRNKTVRVGQYYSHVEGEPLAKFKEFGWVRARITRISMYFDIHGLREYLNYLDMDMGIVYVINKTILGETLQNLTLNELREEVLSKRNIDRIVETMIGHEEEDYEYYNKRNI
jgi:hypothetical protein